ncbi:MAG: EAL domain-containing protein [gamma proteobacterium symbiont of Taylorina sp.]|nr:EAL domain-containing protein [gamma proteobacterium symbiont of Taylorina sp.]
MSVKSYSEISIQSIMHSQVLTCSIDDSIQSVAAKMQAQNASSVIVVKDNIPVGIWTEADALKLDFNIEALFFQPIRNFMSTPVQTMKQQVLVSTAALAFQEQGIRHFVVVDDEGAMQGIISQSDIIFHQSPESFFHVQKINKVLNPDFLSLDLSLSIASAISQIYKSSACSVIVTGFADNEYGIITERDIVQVIANGNISDRLEKVANKPLLTIHSEQSLIEAQQMLVENNIRHLGVINKNKVIIGILTFEHILKGIQYEYVHYLEDILKQRDDALVIANKNLLLAHSVLESTQEGIMVVDTHGKIEMVNPAFSTVTGYTEEEVIGKNPNILRSERHNNEFYKQMWEQINKVGYWQGEIWNKRKTGEIYPEWLSINTIFDEDRVIQGYASIFTDITERKKVEERIKNLAYYDFLTKLPNRRLLLDRLDIATANAKRHNHILGLMFLDLDFFKRINDTLGHAGGDELLKQVAERLSSFIREGDTLARIGGDEFVVVLAELGKISELTQFAKRTLEQMKKPFYVMSQELFISCSIGISLFPEDGEDPDTLLKHADTAMYRIKDLGRNGFELYAKSMDSKSIERLSMETSLHKALEKNEFFLTYQVKVDLSTGNIAGIEALIRWDHPDLGILQPDSFIELAEQTGLILPIGQWVLEEACRQNKQWQKMGLPYYRVAVNVSVHQFCREEIFLWIENALELSGLDAKYLELEITESSIMKKLERAKVTIKQLKETGVSISIDDFGTGFSSLAYLKEFTIDFLKIDRSFLTHLLEEKKDQAIVSAIISMAKHLDIKVIAEGVELEEQVEFLKMSGCDEIQGFLISRPMTADNVVTLFEQKLLPSL